MRDRPLLKTVYPWSAGYFRCGFWACPESDRLFPKRDGYGVKALYVFESLDHEEVKAQEGKTSCQDTNHALAAKSIFTRTKALKTTKDVERSFS